MKTIISVLVASLALGITNIAHAGGPQPGQPELSICSAWNYNKGNCSDGGWLFQCATSTEYPYCNTTLPCSATGWLYSPDWGYPVAVWIDDSDPNRYTDAANCKAAGLAKGQIYVGCYIGMTNCDISGVENMGEFYPYRPCGNGHGYCKPWQAYGCSNNVDAHVNGFITQQFFGWEQNTRSLQGLGLTPDGDDYYIYYQGESHESDSNDLNADVPTQNQAADEWTSAISCTSSYDEPMGTY